MTAAATPAGPRTVGEIMSRPVVTATADETVAAAADACASSASARSSWSTATSAVGILTERDLVRLAAAGADASTTVADWMTPDPDSVGPDVDATDAFASLAEHGYRHIPVVDDGRLVGIVSMRDLMRIAQIQPAENLAHEVPARPRRRRRRRDDDRRRPRPRRLLPLPPVQRGRARREAHDRGRVVPAVRGRPPDAAPARAVPRRDPSVSARSPRRGEGGAPRDRAVRHPTRRRSICCARRCRCSARRSASSRRSTSRRRAARRRRCRCARWCRRCSPRSTASSTACRSSTRTPSSRTRRTTST